MSGAQWSAERLRKLAETVLFLDDEDGGPQVAPTWIWERRVAALERENARLRRFVHRIAVYGPTDTMDDAREALEATDA